MMWSDSQTDVHVVLAGHVVPVNRNLNYVLTHT